MENTKDRENVEDVEQEDRPTDQVPTPQEMAVKYGSFLEQCFDIATSVMETHEMMEGEGIDRPLQSAIAFRIFDRCTRETSGLETMVQMAMSYLSMIIQDKATESERSAELRASAPFMPSFGAGFLHVGECKHSGLKALHEQLDVDIKPPLDLPAGMEREGWAKTGGADAAAAIIQAMTLETGADTGVGALMCPHCRALVPVDKVTSGELWSDEPEPEEAEEEEETEATREAVVVAALKTPRGRAIHAGLEKFFEEDVEVEIEELSDDEESENEKETKEAPNDATRTDCRESEKPLDSGRAGHNDA